MLSQPVTKEFVLKQLDKLSPEGLAEVAEFIEFLQFRAQQPVPKDSLDAHAAFGIWADHPDAQNPAAFALKLRRTIEQRENGEHHSAG